MTMTIEKAAQYYRDGYWFTGDSCGKCGTTENILRCASTHGYFCGKCGHYVAVVWNMNTLPHDKPDIGLTTDELKAAIRLSKGGDKSK
jgi:hypothetical protein